MTRGYAVALTIPDNAAFTALVTLQRLGVACDELQRAEIYLFDVDPEHVEALDRSVPMLETIYNPNKHRLRGCGAAPEPGEVWIGDWGTEVAVRGPALRIAGRELAGVRTLRRYT
ncbi:MAG: hypothetical protein ACREQ5_40985, partial [Candidatus Dormibacteria bacterium]